MSPTDEVVVTGPLELRPMTAADAGALWPLLSDPRLWTYDPGARHTDRSRTELYAARAEARWSEGLSYWTVRLRATREVIGSGGAQRHGVLGDGDGPDGAVFWNLNYRVAVAHQGAGHAGRVLAAALAAASRLAPGRPAIAWVDATNRRSHAVARRAGLLDRGPRRNPVDPVVRHAWSDRSLDEGHYPRSGAEAGR